VDRQQALERRTKHLLVILLGKERSTSQLAYKVRIKDLSFFNSRDKQALGQEV
jgi:hypothetical protein